tara:strand:- start:12254 stop:12523 length:270 start_codon:yes stop_codon:yes gene_type:complete
MLAESLGARVMWKYPFPSLVNRRMRRMPQAERRGGLWLVDLICPFHTTENKMANQMRADLITGPFKGKQFKFHHSNPARGQRKVMELGG